MFGRSECLVTVNNTSNGILLMLYITVCVYEAVLEGIIVEERTKLDLSGRTNKNTKKGGKDL